MSHTPAPTRVPVNALEEQLCEHAVWLLLKYIKEEEEEEEEKKKENKIPMYHLNKEKRVLAPQVLLLFS